jgi:hypothetical protein
MTGVLFNDTLDCEDGDWRVLRGYVGLASGRIVLTF